MCPPALAGITYAMRSPTVAQFEAALHTLTKPSDKLKKLLIAHLKAPKHAMTATLLSQEAGYKTFRGFNAAYGHLAKKLGRAMKRPGERLGLIADFTKPRELTNAHWIVYLKPNFARAVRNHDWLRAE